MQLCALFFVLCVAAASSTHFGIDLDAQWKEFKRVFGKSYDGPEDASKQATWYRTVQDIVLHNLMADMGLRSYRRGLNAFADQDIQELVVGWKVRAKNVSTHVTNPQQLPDAVDWREKGAVTPVRNQGQCGAPWSFSATGALEGQNQIKTGRLVTLSVQNLIDCAPSQGGGGCSGSLMDMDSAFEYVKKNGGIDTEESYPTTGQVGTCRFRKEGVGATCSGYVDLPSGDEGALKQAVALRGPVASFIDASHVEFQTYVSGVYDEPNCSSDQLDHAILIVGYGTENGVDYWIVKNSWGSNWGEKGYIRMKRNSSNQCGIATMASYPLP